MKKLIAVYSGLTISLDALALGEDLTAASLGPTSVVGETLVNVVVGTGLVLVLIGIAAWFLRRYMAVRGNGGLISIRGGLALGSRERIVLVEVRGMHLLLGVSPGRVQKLHVFDPAVSGPGFAAELALADVRGRSVGEGTDVAQGSNGTQSK